MLESGTSCGHGNGQKEKVGEGPKWYERLAAVVVLGGAAIVGYGKWDRIEAEVSVKDLFTQGTSLLHEKTGEYQIKEITLKDGQVELVTTEDEITKIPFNEVTWGPSNLFNQTNFNVYRFQEAPLESRLWDQDSNQSPVNLGERIFVGIDQRYFLLLKQHNDLGRRGSISILRRWENEYQISSASRENEEWLFITTSGEIKLPVSSVELVQGEPAVLSNFTIKVLEKPNNSEGVETISEEWQFVFQTP